MIFMKALIRLNVIGLAAMLSPIVYAVNNNPATIQYVDDAVQAGVQRLSYVGGTGINILGNIISGAYTAGTGISISGAQISGAYTAGTGISISDAQISVNPVVSVGDLYQGGVVVFVDSTGQHGLIIALSDAAESGDHTINYSKDSNEFGIGNGIGQGLINSAAVLGGTTDSTDPNIMTAIAETYLSDPGCAQPSTGQLTAPTVNCYAGWYAPSIFEWELLISNFTTVQNALSANGTALTTNAYYWSSTIKNNNDKNSAYVIQFSDAGVATADTYDIDGSQARARGFRQF